MSKHAFHHGLCPAAEHPLASTLQFNRAVIQISWNEGVIKRIKIRHQPVDLGWKVCRIEFRPDSRPEHDAQFALKAELQMIFASGQGSRMT